MLPRSAGLAWMLVLAGFTLAVPAAAALQTKMLAGAVNLMTAVQNYQMEQLGVWEFWTYQLSTLNAMTGYISDYDLVLTGHAPVLDSSSSIMYVNYSIEVMANQVPYITFP